MWIIYTEFCVSVKEHCQAELDANFVSSAVQAISMGVPSLLITLFSELIGFYRLVIFAEWYPPVWVLRSL